MPLLVRDTTAKWGYFQGEGVDGMEGLESELVRAQGMNWHYFL